MGGNEILHSTPLRIKKKGETAGDRAIAVFMMIQTLNAILYFPVTVSDAVRETLRQPLSITKNHCSINSMSGAPCFNDSIARYAYPDRL
jgi:hypothetical protein